MLKVLPVIERATAFCQLPFNKMYLDGYGNISMCCYQKHTLGSVFNDDLLTVWNSPLAQEIRQDTLNGVLHPVCKSWNACPFLVTEKVEYDFEAHQKFRYPIHIDIALPNTHCNIGGEEPSKKNKACIMCSRNWSKPDQPPITWLLCQKTKPLMKYLKYLTVCGVAEPFWKDMIFQVFEWLDFAQYKDRVQFATNTNVTCLTKPVVNRLFSEVDICHVNFSIDSGSPETYLKIRRLKGYNRILNNIRYFIKKRGPKHRAWIWNNINILNVHEMVKMVEAASDLGVDGMTFTPTNDAHSPGVRYLLMNKDNVGVFKENAQAAKERAEELKIQLIFNSSFEAVPPEPLLPVLEGFVDAESCP